MLIEFSVKVKAMGTDVEQKVGLRELKKQVFYDALRSSLKDLSDKNVGKITQSMVIANAKFKDGKSVGETTIFGKSRNGEFIHKAFMKELDELIEIANKPLKKRGAVGETASAKAERLNQEKKALQEEYDSVLKQFIELQAQQKNAALNSDSNRVKSLETDLYIFSSLLRNKIGNSIKKVITEIENYEMKYSGTETLEHAQKMIDDFEHKIYQNSVVEISSKDRN